MSARNRTVQYEIAAGEAERHELAGQWTDAAKAWRRAKEATATLSLRRFAAGRAAAAEVRAKAKGDAR